MQICREVVCTVKATDRHCGDIRRDHANGLKKDYVCVRMRAGR